MSLFDSLHSSARDAQQAVFGASFTHDRTSTSLTAALSVVRSENEDDSAGQRDIQVATLSWKAEDLAGVIVRDGFTRASDGTVWAVRNPPTTVGGMTSADVEQHRRRIAGRI